MKRFLVAAALTLSPLHLFAQTSGVQADAPPTTSPGHELSFIVDGYDYVEPGDTRISIHGLKFGGEYAGTFLPLARAHWFVQGNVRANVGRTDYDGWCAPWFIRPDPRSPNGYFLDLGDYSPCTDDGNQDWYFEGRALSGKDFVGQRWTWSPQAGLGIRHLSNGLDEITGFRVDDYLYLPAGITARTAIAPHRVLSLNFEYDHLLHGWQNTRDSALGGGDLPATPIAPAFTINGFTDVSFDQQHGFGMRASAKYEINRWSLEPYWIYWNVDDSLRSDEEVTFTVRGISAIETFGAVEPQNTTNEFGVKFSVRFR